MAPRILLFDEPTSNLDEQSSRQFYALLEMLHQQQDRANILIEHRLHLLARMADRLIILQAGQIRYNGDPHPLPNKDWRKTWGGEGEGDYIIY